MITICTFVWVDLVGVAKTEGSGFSRSLSFDYISAILSNTVDITT